MSMTAADLFRELWEHEHRNTVSVLEAIPGDQMNYVPWEGAMDMRQLALHVIGVEEFFIRGVVAGELTVGGSRRDQAEIRSPADLVAFCKERHEALRPLAEQLDDTVMAREIPFKAPNGAVLRVSTGRQRLFSDLLHHVIHHRGQLVTYLRLVGAPVPGIYGPTREQMPPMA
jgi:uncharacterized damage-inducible protein DinB